jgi:cyclopropane fatty-acyl-phospholipid synthase-like methyltransferase
MTKQTALVTKSDIEEVTRIYFDQYQRDSVAEQAIAAYDSIAEVLVRTFRPKTSMDLGAGGGALVRGLGKRGVDALGVEGSRHAVDLLPDRIALGDLRTPLELRGFNELTTCFDVAEHIEPRPRKLSTSYLLDREVRSAWVWFVLAVE